MQTTKVYENTTEETVNIIGVGDIEPHGRISITSDFHAPVNLANYPGVVDVLAEEAANGRAIEPLANDSASDQPAKGVQNV
jgi:predicted deacetylase